MNDFEEANNDFTETLRIDENHVKALAKRASCHFKLSEFEDCMTDCEEVLKLSAMEFTTRNLLAEAKMHLKVKRVKNRYEILGVSQSSDMETIKKAFHTLSLRYHSDKCPTANAIDKKKLDRKFKEIRDAYDYIVNRRK